MKNVNSVAFFSRIDKTIAPIKRSLFFFYACDHANQWISNQKLISIQIDRTDYDVSSSNKQLNLRSRMVAMKQLIIVTNIWKCLAMLCNAFECTFINGMMIILALAFAISMAIDDRKLFQFNYKYKLLNCCCPFFATRSLKRETSKNFFVFRLRSIRLMQIVSHMYDKQISTAAKMKYELKIKCCFFCCRRHKKKKNEEILL